MIDPKITDKGIKAISVMTDIKTEEFDTLRELAVSVALMIFKVGLSKDDYFHPLLNRMREIRRNP